MFSKQARPPSSCPPYLSLNREKVSPKLLFLSPIPQQTLFSLAIHTIQNLFAAEKYQEQQEEKERKKPR